jgi:hypothetical protein
MMTRGVLLAAWVCAASFVAHGQSCQQYQTTFDAFLKKHNPFIVGGNKATLSTIRAELGAPSSIRTENTGSISAVYDAPR